MVMHAEVRAEQGRLWEADESFRQAVRLLSESGFELSPAAGVVRIGMADLLYERDDVDGAERDLERGVELAERTGDVSTLVWAYVTLSRTERARGTRGALSKGPARRSASPVTPAPICRSPSPRPGWRGCAWRRETSRKLAPSNGSARERGRRRCYRAGRGPDKLGEGSPRPGTPPRGAAAPGAAAGSRRDGGTSARPHRDLEAAGSGAVGVERKGAGREHPGGSPRFGGTGRLRQNLRRRGPVPTAWGGYW